MPDARFAVGIDLGTSNTVVAFAPLSSSAAPEVFPIRQLVAPHQVEARDLYPSMLFAATEAELAADPFAEAPWVTGEIARRRGVEVPARLVASAKSWLCHARVDRRAPILPPGAAEGDPRISPVGASERILAHVRRVWDDAHPDAPLASQAVVLTVPASFDEIARELTLEAARGAGLAPRLLEEPIAAFYAARAAGAVDDLTRGDRTATILVCDVGGGTTDLSLLGAHRDGDSIVAERLAVGRHLLLGGDNMDLALAHAIEARFVAPPARLAPGAFAQLVAGCRAAKEAILADGGPDEVPVRVVEAGAKLVGGVRTAPLRRSDVETILVAGFFPDAFDAAARPRAGLVGFGLPYEADTVVPRHVVRFLDRQASPAVDAVLFHGGVFHARGFTESVRRAVATRSDRDVVVVASADPDRAVAIGAVLHALSAERGNRVVARAPRSYYVGAGGAGAPRAVALIPRGTDEGATVELASPTFTLTVGAPVRFDLFTDDRPATGGDVVAIDDTHERLPPLVLAIDGHDLRRAATTVPVRLGATLEDTGTLAIHLTEQGEGGRRHLLRFDLRRATTPSTLPPPPSLPPKLADARAAIDAVFGRGNEPEKAAKELPDRLDQLLGPRATWTGPTLRALFDALAAQPGARKRSATHERIFFSIAGYTLRPGFGDAGDPARVDLMARLFAERLAFPDETRGWQQLFVAYRRIAGGLGDDVQSRIREALDPFVAPPSAGLAKPKKWRPLADGELLDLVSALERASARDRAALGEWVLDLALGKRSPHPWACLGRIGAREPAYASAHHVVDPVTVERWIEQLLRQKWDDLPPAPAIAVRLARVTGDRARDVSIRVRKDVEKRLLAVRAKDDLVRAVREHVPLAAADRAELFGDALPQGLALDEVDEVAPDG